MSQIDRAPAERSIGERATGDNRRYHVAHLHSTLGVYGAERWTYALLKHLNPRQFESIVISVGTKPGADSFYRLMTAEGFSAFHIAIPGRLNPRAVLQLRRLLVRQGIDILHTHGFKADVLGYLATRALRLRLVSTIHGWTADEGFQIKVYEAISRTFLKRFDRIYPLSPGLLEHLTQCKFDPLKLQLILNGVDLSAFDFHFNERQAGDPFSLLFVGRLCRPKGIFDLLEAFARVQTVAQVKLSVVGDGPDRLELEALSRALGVADKVKFVGAVASIVPLLKESHALVLPSYSEGIPRVVMEAFAAGVPVIGTSIPGIRQLVEEGLTGLMVPVGDPNSLTQAIRKLCERPDWAQRMASNARQVVIDKYSASRMAEDFQREYRRLCSAA